MRRSFLPGFTFLEILFSIVVFSVGMLAYMDYQARTTSILFETESSVIATGLAVEIAEELNSVTEEDMRVIVEDNFTTFPSNWVTDAEFKALSGLFNWTPGPFDEFGRPISGGGVGMFNRMVRVTSFNNLTGSNYEENTPLEVLRVVEIVVAWRQKDAPTAQCNVLPLPAGCNEVRNLVIKPIYYY